MTFATTSQPIYCQGGSFVQLSPDALTSQIVMALDFCFANMFGFLLGSCKKSIHKSSVAQYLDKCKLLTSNVAILLCINSTSRGKQKIALVIVVLQYQVTNVHNENWTVTAKTADFADFVRVIKG